MEFSETRGPQYIPINYSLSHGESQKGTPNFGNPHVGVRISAQSEERLAEVGIQGSGFGGRGFRV